MRRATRRATGALPEDDSRLRDLLDEFDSDDDDAPRRRRKRVGGPGGRTPTPKGMLKRNALGSSGAGGPPTALTAAQRAFLAAGEGSPGAAADAADAPWPKDQDEALRDSVLRHGEDWAAVAARMRGAYGRDEAACAQRWAAIKDGPVKGPWTREEDRLLSRLVAEHGPKRWSKIAESIPGRVGKQCRERWLNHLDGNVKKSPWTPEEDAVLMSAQERVGNRWSEIAKLLPGRAENAVKNRYNSIINRRWSDELAREEAARKNQRTLGALAAATPASSVSARAAAAAQREADAQAQQQQQQQQGRRAPPPPLRQRVESPLRKAPREAFSQQESSLLDSIYGALGSSGSVPGIPPAAGPAGVGVALANDPAQWGAAAAGAGAGASAMASAKSDLDREVERERLFRNVNIGDADKAVLWERARKRPTVADLDVLDLDDLYVAAAPVPSQSPAAPAAPVPVPVPDLAFAGLESSWGRQMRPESRDAQEVAIDETRASWEFRRQFGLDEDFDPVPLSGSGDGDSSSVSIDDSLGSALLQLSISPSSAAAASSSSSGASIRQWLRSSMSPTARQLSAVNSQFREGRLSAEQKNKLKESIIAGSTPRGAGRAFWS